MTTSFDFKFHMQTQKSDIQTLCKVVLRAMKAVFAVKKKRISLVRSNFHKNSYGVIYRLIIGM